MILEKNLPIWKNRKQNKNLKLKTSNLKAEVEVDLMMIEKRKMMAVQAMIPNVMMNSLMTCQLEILNLLILKRTLKCVLLKDHQFVRKFLENIMLKVFLKHKW
jgi:hypothetical protein